MFILCTLSDIALYLYQVSRTYLSDIALNICTKFQEHISKGFTAICILKFTKENNSVKSVGGVIVLVMFTSPGDALYWYQVWPKYFKSFPRYRPG